MSHPNIELARDLVKCTEAEDVSSVELVAIPGKRKGYLLQDNNTKRFVLTSKGLEFVSKWHKQTPKPQATVKKA